MTNEKSRFYIEFFSSTDVSLSTNITKTNQREINKQPDRIASKQKNAPSFRFFSFLRTYLYTYIYFIQCRVVLLEVKLQL